MIDRKILPFFGLLPPDFSFFTFSQKNILKTITPRDIVKIEPKVEIVIIFPLIFELLPIASAITKDATAVGVPIKMNKIKRSWSVNPRKYPIITEIIGKSIIL